MKNKKGGMSTKQSMATILGIFLIAAIVIIFVARQPTSITPTDDEGNVIVPISACPDTGQTTVTLSLQNSLNTTGSETFDTNTVLIGDEGDYQTGTDTTAGSYTLNCGETYTLYVRSAAGAAGDNGKIDSVKLGTDAKINSDGTATFTPTGSAYTLILGSTQHSLLEFRAYDNANAGFMCDSDASCSAYELDGVSFESTTNGTALAVGSGGELDISFDARATITDGDANDFYTLILVEAPVATWNEPTVKVEGIKLTDVKGSLTTHEEKQFSSYEYIYKFDQAITDDGISVDFVMKALAGVNPSTDPEVDFISAANYLSVDGINVYTGAADDTTTATVVFAVQDITIDIS